ncbi:hypothetical protein E3N88_03454 [Mikania micrantha]|uniref:Uncharacterized protein n=1 Tax=Mikania micrantha TaxID=192012 RepID=A0A5N6Q8W3_9ASTR|nr:hypothetical protein E3N88_03454 [Mikania micrantha]
MINLSHGQYDEMGCDAIAQRLLLCIPTELRFWFLHQLMPTFFVYCRHNVTVSCPDSSRDCIKGQQCLPVSTETYSLTLGCSQPYLEMPKGYHLPWIGMIIRPPQVIAFLDPTLLIGVPTNSKQLLDLVKKPSEHWHSLLQRFAGLSMCFVQASDSYLFSNHSLV